MIFVLFPVDFFPSVKRQILVQSIMRLDLRVLTGLLSEERVCGFSGQVDGFAVCSAVSN